MSKQLFQFQISKINEEESLLTITSISNKLQKGYFYSSNDYCVNIAETFGSCSPARKRIVLSYGDFSTYIPNSQIKTIKRALKEFHSYCYKKFSKIVPKKKSLQDYLKERNVTEDELLELFESGVFKSAIKYVDLGGLVEEWSVMEEQEELSETYSKMFLRN